MFTSLLGQIKNRPARGTMPRRNDISPHPTSPVLPAEAVTQTGKAESPCPRRRAVSLLFVVAPMLFLSLTTLPRTGFAQSSGYTLTIAAQSGDVIGGTRIDSVNLSVAPAINNRGEVVFNARVNSNGTSRSALFTQNRLVAMSGMVIGGKTLTDISPRPGISDDGTVVFSSFFVNGGNGIFTQSTNIAASGEIVPGLNRKIFTVDLPAITANNRVVYDARYFKPANSGNNIAGLLGYQAGTHSVVVEGVGDGQAGTTYPGPPAVSDQGQIAFYGYYRPFNNSGEVFAVLSTVGLIAQRGTVISGRTLEGVYDPNNFGPSINNQGVTSFLAYYLSANRTAISGGYTQNALIAEVGSVIGGRTMASFGRGTAINDAGTVAFVAYGNNTGAGLFTQSALVAGSGTPVGNTTISSIDCKPAINQSGQIAFIAEFANGKRGIVLATPINRPPDAVDDSAGTVKNTPVTLPVLANDTDADNDTITLTSATPGTNGSVTVSNGTITYTPNAGFVGADSFTYTISDGRGNNDTATVRVQVNEPAVVVVSGVSTITRADGVLTATVQLKNTGGTAASNIVVTTAQLASAPSTTNPLPTLASLAPGATATVTLTFPGTAGASGATVYLKVVGTYGGGNFSTNRRVVLP